MNVHAKPSTRKSKRLGAKYRMRASDFAVVAMGFRTLRNALGQENPHWSHDDTVRYMYENDDDFKTFFDRQPSAARLIVDPTRTDENIADFIKTFKAYEAGLIPATEIMAHLLPARPKPKPKSSR